MEFAGGVLLMFCFMCLSLTNWIIYILETFISSGFTLMSTELMSVSINT